MALTKTDLLTVRYKVIASYPGMNCEVGQILDRFLANGKLLVPMKTGGEEFKFVVGADEMPHLFQKMAWWESRTVDEMPKYVKHKITEACYHVTEWDLNIFYVKDGEVVKGVANPDLYDYIGAGIVLPINKEEYETYKRKS